ncbi:hypothetical protein CA600_12445 [Paenibacillus sp. VTT E-133280]|uniref:hypothetical protein n=1 Tax=Paenibacillus sp. VTT E-133280 TaxID=1986222 RepID=UPI000B9FFFD4|nr:hypothetical protein [Paenibacillus sp. VTT E-133280]OZQ66062.1 hypothetical protein CA600_12445 [Paenibacillus sp. VTT E-133280]
MRPLVFDGVGTVSVYQTDGTLKYLDDKISKVSLQLQLDWQKVMGGESGYAFHYTAQDLADKASIEIPRFSTILAEISQGAETERGTVKFNETETGVLVATDGYTVKAPAKYGGAFVVDSDKVFLKDEDTGELVPLTRAATAPTANQYSITAAGKITTDVTNNGKVVVVTFAWTKEDSTKSKLSGKRRPKPFKLVHRFELIDDASGNPVPCQLTIWKALGGGTLDVSQERKKPTSNTMTLEIMEPDISADNPDGVAVELIFGI